MRVSSQQLFDSSVSSIQQYAGDAVKWQTQISSGQRYQTASQNPAAAGAAVRFHFDQSRIQMLQANQNAVSSTMSQADSQLTSMQNIMTSLEQLASQANDGSLGPNDLQTLAIKADQLNQQLNQLAVAKDGNGKPVLQPLSTLPPINTVGTSTSATQITMSTVQGISVGQQITDATGRVLGSVTEINGTTLTLSQQIQVDAGTAVVYPSFSVPATANPSVPTATVTVPSTSGIEIGQAVTGVAGIPANTVVAGISGNTVTFNNAVTLATGSAQISFTPAATVTSSQTVTQIPLASATGVEAGQAVYGAGLPPDAKVASVKGNTITLSSSVAFGLPVGTTLSFAQSVTPVEIEPGLYVPGGITRAEVLGISNVNNPESIDVLGAVQNLVDQLKSGLRPSTEQSDAISQARVQIQSAQVKVGLIGAQVDASTSALQTESTAIEDYRSKTLDTDLAEASAGLTRSQTLLQAARSIFSNLESTNLFQKLG